MCWSETASVGMVVVGTAATVLTASRREPPAIWGTIAFFTLMEALQVAGYAVVDECGTSANRAVTMLSMLHIVAQPFFINAFTLQLIPAPARERLVTPVFAICALCSGVMLLQLLPLEWAGRCLPGTSLCGAQWCVVSGAWHIAWHVPFNGLLVPFERAIGTGVGFPTYIIAVFVMPLVYGAWRFVGFHALAGPLLASAMTGDPNEVPAVWCLFSIGLLLAALSPPVRRWFRAESWWPWPTSWRV